MPELQDCILQLFSEAVARAGCCLSEDTLFFLVFSSILRWAKGLWLHMSPKRGSSLLSLSTHSDEMLLVEILDCAELLLAGTGGHGPGNPCSGQGHLQRVVQGCVHHNLNVSKGGDAPACLELTLSPSVTRALGKPGWCPPQIFRLFLLLASPRRAGSRGSSVLAGIWWFGGGYGSYQAIWRRLPDRVWKTVAVLTGL